jgi:PAS domain S-box-containing protein
MVQSGVLLEKRAHFPNPALAQSLTSLSPHRRYGGVLMASPFFATGVSIYEDTGMQTTVDLSSLVAALGDAVVVSDVSGAITLWNKAAERIFGYSEAEALGQTLDIITPERLRERHWEGYAKTMATGITRYGADVLQVPAIDKAGRSLSIAFTVALLHSADGKVCAIAAVIRDDTKRFEKDRAQRKRINELEAQLKGTAPSVADAAASLPPTGCLAHRAD